ncbi:MAG TPA: hypothetical protein VFQ53_05685 [Kofleriaceae bacterium]|nr:hypothetical protein [Kofleriaceae bacterium]
MLAGPGATRAAADPCTGITKSGGRFATCFDLGNRLSVTAGTNGFGGALALRHVIHFDDEPDLVWKLEHAMLETTYAGFEDRLSAVLYRGHFVRHARDGHLVLPFGTPPKKIFLPFDIGALVEAGSITWRPGSSLARVGVVKTAGLVDFARSRGFRRRIAFGPVARWDVDVDRDARALSEHIVAPFTAGLGNVHVESSTGRTLADLRVEAGWAWQGSTGWTPRAEAEAIVERIVLAVNDRPIALTMGVRYDSTNDETLARVGARIVLFDRRDPRVSLERPRTAAPAAPAAVPVPAPEPQPSEPAVEAPATDTDTADPAPASEPPVELSGPIAGP